MTALLLAMAASGAWGLSDFLGGVRARTLALPVVLAGSQAAGLLVLLGVLVVHPGGVADAPPLRDVGLAALAGAAGAAALGLLYLAMARGGVAIVAPVSAGSALLAVGAGLARGERLGPASAAGVALALVGTTAAVARSRTARRPHVVVLLAAAGAAIGSATFFTAIQAASAGGALTATVVNRVAATALVAAWALGSRPDLRAVRSAGPGALLAVAAVGVTDAVAELCFASASTRAPMSVVTPLASLYPAVAVLLAATLLRERLHRRGALGVACAVAGVVLLGGS